MEKVNPLSALWRIVRGKEETDRKLLDLDEITGEKPELVEILKKARDKAEANAENRFKDDLYKQAKSSSDSKNIARGKRRAQTTMTNSKKEQMTIDYE